jgi:hypothetical protein
MQCFWAKKVKCIKDIAAKSSATLIKISSIILLTIYRCERNYTKIIDEKQLPRIFQITQRFFLLQRLGSGLNPRLESVLKQRAEVTEAKPEVAQVRICIFSNHVKTSQQSILILCYSLEINF